MGQYRAAEGGKQHARESKDALAHMHHKRAERDAVKLLLFGGGVFLCCIFKEKKRGRKGVACGKEEEMGIEKDSTKMCKRVLATSGCSVCTID